MLNCLLSPGADTGIIGVFDPVIARTRLKLLIKALRPVETFVVESMGLLLSVHEYNVVSSLEVWKQEQWNVNVLNLELVMLLFWRRLRNIYTYICELWTLWMKVKSRKKRVGYRSLREYRLWTIPVEVINAIVSNYLQYIKLILRVPI